MNISYDKTADAVYILLNDSIVERTIEIDPGTLVDVNRSGELVGIEVIRPARDWPLGRIASDYNLDDEDVRALEALWPNDRGTSRFPFTRRTELTV